MDKPKVTPKDFFLWAGAMIALYSSVFAFLSLLFSYIDYAYPDTLSYSYDPYSTGMRASIAALFVLFPLALILLRVIRRSIEKDPTRAEIWVRRWALVFTVFVAGAALVIDLITLINYFLGGDLTMRFVLKVLLVLLVGTGAFTHFLADIWGYWYRNPNHARAVSWGASALVAGGIIVGFFIMGTPGQVRLYKFDDQRVEALNQLQSQVISYWQAKEKLPASTALLADPLSGTIVPVDPQTGESYEYRVTKAPFSFELCAVFAASSTSGIVPPIRAMGEGTWQHTAGRVCFERTIDPDKYPPFKKPF